MVVSNNKSEFIKKDSADEIIWEGEIIHLKRRNGLLTHGHIK